MEIFLILKQFPYLVIGGLNLRALRVSILSQLFFLKINQGTYTLALHIIIFLCSPSALISRSLAWVTHDLVDLLLIELQGCHHHAIKMFQDQISFFMLK